MRFRQSAGRVFGANVVDFECPVALPWLEHDASQEVLAEFGKKLDTLFLTKLVQEERPNDVLPLVNMNMAANLVEQQFAVRGILPSDHKLVKALDEYVRVTALKHSCTSCVRKKMLQMVAVALQECSVDDKLKLVSSISLTQK